MDSLSHLGWKNRVVLVFGNADDPEVVRQTKILLTKKAELDERNMVVIGVSKAKVTRVYGEVPNLDPANIRKEADIDSDDFQVVLVGKDGGIKLRSQNVVGNVEMFDLIDRMPMRRAERD